MTATGTTPHASSASMTNSRVNSRVHGKQGVQQEQHAPLSTTHLVAELQALVDAVPLSPHLQVCVCVCVCV